MEIYKRLVDRVQNIAEMTAEERFASEEAKVDDPSQSARAFYVSSPEPKD